MQDINQYKNIMVNLVHNSDLVHISGHAVTPVISARHSCTIEKNRFRCYHYLIDDFVVVIDHIGYNYRQRLDSGSGQHSIRVSVKLLRLIAWIKVSNVNLNLASIS